MSKMRRLLSCLGLVLLGSRALFADPLVALPSGDMACSVAITAHAGTAIPDPAKPPVTGAPGPAGSAKPATGAPVMKTDEIVQVKKLRRDIFTWSNGETSETWTIIDSGMTMAEKTVGPSKFIYEMSRGSVIRNVVCPTMLDLDAASTTWISPQSFTGKADHGGKASLHYQARISLPMPAGPPRTVLYQAWIDPKTFVPIALDDGDALYELTFAPQKPTEPLVLPVRFQKDLQQYQNANATIRHL